jgi:hypothetical protein
VPYQALGLSRHPTHGLNERWLVVYRSPDFLDTVVAIINPMSWPARSVIGVQWKPSRAHVTGSSNSGEVRTLLVVMTQRAAKAAGGSSWSCEDGDGCSPFAIASIPPAHPPR